MQSNSHARYIDYMGCMGNAFQWRGFTRKGALEEIPVVSSA